AQGSNTAVQAGYIKPAVPVIPTAAFRGNITAGPTPLAVQFTDRSTGYPKNWLWDFGDGTTSTVRSPLHTYTAAGNYTVTLTATNTQGSNNLTQNAYIRASTPVVPTATFTGNVTSGPTPLAVQFRDRSLGYPKNWSWDFGDGTTSTAQNPLHTYPAAGNYTVSLTATNAQGSNTMTRAAYIRTSIPVIPTAAFIANRTSATAPAGIQFTDRSTGYPKNWLWDFGDGSTSVIRSPVHVYSATGNYSVSLSVTNAQGTNVTVKTNYLRIG
ncbi:MAG: PKD domain-containing protein, partial [Methanomicrobiales archaeon]|nr:PKD domain-containing protein [Methanomicrobiales archaeon]